MSDADSMKNIWRKYMEKFINAETEWDGEVDCPEIMGLVVTFLNKRMQQLLKD